MARFENQTFDNETVTLDGNEYSDCAFQNCELIFAASDGVSLERCRFTNVQWTFNGAAGRTVKFLRGLYSAAGPGGRELVEQTFASIRQLPTSSPTRD